MLVLFETAAGFALFKVLDEGKVKQTDDLWKEFETPTKAQKIVALKSFSKFDNTADALASATALVESKMSKDLKKFLKKNIVTAQLKDSLAVADSKLGSVIKDKLGIKCVHDNSIQELIRGIRLQLTNLVSGMSETDVNTMALGLSHSLSRYKLKFSPDKVDTMIVQAISLLDDMDKELNIYAMRVREWYGWHFPELGKIISDNLLYARLVKFMGYRTNAQTAELHVVLPEDLVPLVREAANISMGTEVSSEDIEHVIELCNQVIEISEYREQLDEYLKTRMIAIAPNLTEMVGVLIGARLIARAGNLMNLAKYPASTVQILGAEKALFRSLKTKQATPKYGLLYHASVVGHATAKNKGKISRVLAAKTSLAVRVDALGETDHVTIGLKARAAVEHRLKQLEAGPAVRASSQARKAGTPNTKYDSKKAAESPALPREKTAHDSSQDFALGAKNGKPKPEPETSKTEPEAEASSSESEDEEDEEEEKKKKKEKKKERKEKKEKKEKEKKEKKDKKKEKNEKKRSREDSDGEKKKKKKKKAKEESSSSDE